MDEVISREEMRSKIWKIRARCLQWRDNGYRNGWMEAMDCAESALNGCRDLDVQTVTRCRECLHAHPGSSDKTLVYCTVHKKYLKADDFCNYGVNVNN